MNKEKNLYGKMNDFKRFGFMLLALTAFLYLGTVMPIAGKTDHKTNVLMLGTIVVLGASAFFFYYSQRCKKVLLESEDGQNLLNK
jgi:thiol:disulfide interchange protein